MVYGHGTEPVHISLPAHETALIIRRANSVLDLDLAGGPLMALVKDVQRDPVRQIIEHLDLIIVRTGEQVEVEVPVLVEGESAPGTVATSTRRRCCSRCSRPRSRRRHREHRGARGRPHITAADVTLPEGAELAADPELLIIGVQLEAAEESAENESAEPRRSRRLLIHLRRSHR